MCDYHGEESLSGGLAKETLLPPGRPATSPPGALPCRAGLSRLPLPSLGRRPPETRCPLPSGTWRRALPCRPGAADPTAALPAPTTAAPAPLAPWPPGCGARVSPPGLAVAPLASREPQDVTWVRSHAPSS